MSSNKEYGTDLQNKYMYHYESLPSTCTNLIHSIVFVYNSFSITCIIIVSTTGI